MLKSLLLIAVTANIFFIVSSTADSEAQAASYSSSSKTSRKSYSSSSSSSTSYSSGCSSSEEDDDNIDDISCGGDPNAMPGCDKLCRKRCPSRQTLKCSCPKKNSCECKDGYVYDSTTYKCVRPKDCTPTCGDTEEYSDCTNGGCQAKNCSQIGKPIPCIKMDPKYCIKGCLCKEGYLRTDDGVCVPKNQCPSECPLPHQVYDSCPVTCPPQTCESIGKIYNCPLQPTNASLRQCKPDCVCEKGYYKNKIEECISKEDCLKCTGPHEYFSCGVACDNVCATLSERNQTNCDIINIMCNRMCYCEEGYARNENNTCIPISECNACGQNEVPSDCVNGGCDKRNCSQLGQPDICIDPLKCIKGCICDTGYLRNDDNVCVPIDKCPPVCEEDEVFSSCVQGHCRAKNCSQLGQPEPFCPRVDPAKCNKGCLCKDGYLRADNGTCIPKEKCPSCGGDPNAIAGCGINCNRHCSDIGKEPGACITLCKGNACDCKEGFYFDDNTGKCVRPKQCTPVCGEDEVYNSCIQGQCSPKNCSELGNPIGCPRIDPKYCIKGCLCKDGYLRAQNGTCIPKECCPSCGGDPNASSGCGINCNRHCSDIGKEPGACITVCYENACDCKKGYYFDDNTGKCVRAKQCTPVCNKNEVYSSCVQGQCGPKNCSQLGTSVPCPRIDPKYCIKGCICAEGYLRADNGTCIPKENCPSCGGDCNARAGCGVNCNKRCSDIGKEPGACIEICYENACDCKDKYYLDEKTGKCVLPKQCSPITSTTTPAPSTDVGDPAERLREGNIKLSLKMLTQLLESKPGVSVVSSAISVLIALAQLTLYAVGPTLNQLLGLLNLRNKDEIKAVFPELVKNYAVQQNVTLELGVKLYGNKDYPLSSPFKEDSYIYFNAEADNIDFSRNVEAAKTINTWVENKTHNLIQNLVSPDMFSADTRLALLNVIYFLGNWQHQFNSNLTENKDFYVTPNKTESIPTMYQQGRFKYAESVDLDAQILEMPYKGGNMSFVTWLPRTKDGLPSMLQKLQDTDQFSKSIKSMDYKTVKIYFPVMDMTTSIDVAEQLKKIGVTEMFDPRSDGLKGLLNKTEPVYVSDVVQKAHVKVDEKGTEAAVATAAIITTRNLPLPPPEIYTFNADHPFAFGIKLQNDMVFFGAFVQ